MEFLSVYNYIIDEHMRDIKRNSQHFWQPWRDLHKRRGNRNEQSQVKKVLYSQRFVRPDHN